jgi:uncharacterized protein YecE (DUF72 family)
MWEMERMSRGYRTGLFLTHQLRHSTVEINNTFSRLPSEEALIRWREMAPADFIFSVKASRFIMHMKRLIDPGTSSEKFFSKVTVLNETLGPILFQLPPRWQANAQRLEEFLEALPSRHQYVLESRDANWACTSVYKLLARFNAGLCLHDRQGVERPEELTADFGYVRFHGPTWVIPHLSARIPAPAGGTYPAMEFAAAGMDLFQ